MNIVANFESSMGSLRKAIASGAIGNGLFQGNETQLSFREKLDAITGNQKLPELISNEKVSANVMEENVQEDPSVDKINQFLSEIETFTEQEIDLADFEDVFLMFPPELVDQIKTFITSIQSGTNQLELAQVNGNAEEIGLLLLTTRYGEDQSFHNKEDLMNLLKHMKMTLSEMPPTNLLGANEVTDVKVKKQIHELIQNLESKFPIPDKTLLEPQSRQQYLQTVHARYFSTPKGIETPLAGITEKLLQKAVNSTQASEGTIRNIVQVGNDTQPKTGVSPEKLLVKPDTTEVARTSNLTNPLGDGSSNQLSKVQQFSLFVEQNGKQLPNQQQFIRQFENILARSSFLNSGGQQKLLINLYPEHLGSLRIELLQSEAGMIARILASTSQAKELVESQLNNLKHTFLAQNISVDKIEVSTQLQHQTERSLQRDGEQQQGQKSGRQQKEQNPQEKNEDQSFTSALLDELVNFKV